MSAVALSLIMEPIADTFHRDGYVVLREAIEPESLHFTLDRLRWLCERQSAQDWSSVHSVALANRLREDGRVVDEITEAVQVTGWLQHLAKRPRVQDAVRALLGGYQVAPKAELHLRVPGRIDNAGAWHQRHALQGGSRRTVTAWFALQDMGWRDGGLMVMPGSHRLGVVRHDIVSHSGQPAPRAIEDREIRMLQLRAGDVVLLNSLLLRALAPNHCPAPRFAAEATYRPEPTPQPARRRRTMKA